MVRSLLLFIVGTMLLNLQSAASAQTAQAPLSDADTKHYRLIFDAQERGDWKTADKEIAALQDRLLMGHVLQQRYMHPTAWRSSYEELSSWLRLYSDHPEAEEIYQLASKRRPRGAASPQRWQPRRWRAIPDKTLHPNLVEDYARVASPSEVRRIEGKVRYHCAKDEPTQALNYISDSKQRNLMTAAQYDRMRSWVAESYYYNEKLDKAKQIAADVAKAHGDEAPLSYWISGLIAYREGRYADAATYFSSQAIVPWQEDQLRAGAGFWAARSALVAGNTHQVIANLDIAAQFPFTFYGQIALGQLGQEGNFIWADAPLNDGQWQSLFNAAPRVKRAAALAQIGETHLAQMEIRWAHGELDASYDHDLVAAAQILNLPSASVTLAMASGGETNRNALMDAALYPLPDYAPNGGFTLDRALLYGIIRQESKFMTEAESRVGAKGLMQLMPRTASYVAGDRSLQYKSGGTRLYEPSYNMQLGQSYIEQLLRNEAQGDLFDMALSYNWGPGNVRRYKAASGIDDQLLLLESIPNPEARDFVEHVISNMWVYRARLGQPAPSRDAVAAGGRALYRSVDY